MQRTLSARWINSMYHSNLMCCRVLLGSPSLSRKKALIWLLITSIIAPSFGFNFICNANYKRTPYTFRARKNEFLLSNTASQMSKNLDEEKSLEEKLNDFLDTPFFDPNQVLLEQEEKISNSSEATNQNPIEAFKSWFANLLVSDYETAEMLYAGLILAFMVWVTQELLRMQLYGDNYVPFTRGGKYGSGFGDGLW